MGRIEQDVTEWNSDRRTNALCGNVHLVPCHHEYVSRDQAQLRFAIGDNDRGRTQVLLLVEPRGRIDNWVCVNIAADDAAALNADLRPPRPNHEVLSVGVPGHTKTRGEQDNADAFEEPISISNPR
jgi:hypothetical protein